MASALNRRPARVAVCSYHTDVGLLVRARLNPKVGSTFGHRGRYGASSTPGPCSKRGTELMPTSTDATTNRPWVPLYERWRHGGWYVTNVQWPSGAAGCVSQNYADGKWRIVCDPRPFATAPTFSSRDEAAYAERDLVTQLREVGSCGCRYLPGGVESAPAGNHRDGPRALTQLRGRCRTRLVGSDHHRSAGMPTCRPCRAN